MSLFGRRRTRSRIGGSPSRRSSRGTRGHFNALQIERLEPRLALAAQPFISEFMASNSSTLIDGDGNASDWIEIYNPTGQTINLAGWHITDDDANLDKWTFPSVPQAVLDPGEYLIVFASSKTVEDYIDPWGYMHTDFALSSGGEYLALTDPLESIVSQYGPTYPPQLGDVSYGLVQPTQMVDLVGATNQTSALVPSNGALDSASANVPPAWTLPGFNDVAWPTSASGVGVGYDAGVDEVNNVPNGTLLPGGPIGFDLTDPEEDGIVNGTITAGGADSSPSNERPPQALDNSVFTKWLAFAPSGTFYQFQFAGGARYAVNGYTITSANDASNRDPYSWTLSGSNDGVNFSVIDTRTAQDFANRFETRYYEFSNNVAFAYYKFDFLTEYGATGNNQPNSIQMAEIELFTAGAVNYDSLIALDVEAAWTANRTSLYQRIEFNVADPAQLASLLLEMQYDDGFVAYLNGHRVASGLAPSLPDYNSQSTGDREDGDTLIPESFNLTAHLDKLIAGVNVLAIHVLNNADSSSDLLSIPKLTAALVPSETAVEAYMPQPSPGAINASIGVTQGPIVTEVTENPPRPADHEDLVITARITPQGSSVTNVTMYYRVMFDAETPVTMVDNGTGFDAIAGDGIFTAVIPAAASLPGQMVRWYVTATDAVADETRYPLYLHPTNSPQYLGTVVQNVGVSTSLPVFEYFVQDVAASGTEVGTRASVYYLGEFYDNVFIRRRGGNTTQGRKFEFNDGYHFLINPDLPRVDEINLNQRGADPTYMRQVLAWELYNAAGVPASLGEAWYAKQNNAYLDVRIFVEQPDSDLLRRTGLDPEGAFYKIGADGVENSVTSSTVGVRKRTRDNEDNSDLQALVDGVRPSNPNRVQYAFDNIDIAASINYIAATSIMHDNDHPHKNFHLYRDTEGSGQWTLIPWDKDLTFGLNNGISGVIGDLDPFSHPFFGDQQHQKIDNQWNRMIDALFDIPVVREMYVRRLRTLMDQFLGAPGSTGSWLQTRVAELTAELQPHVGGGSWLNEVSRIAGEYLTERRQHLYVNHSLANPGYFDNAGIPAAQVGNPTINFGLIDANPANGDQDQEYIQLVNPNATAVDISGWRLTGAIEHAFRAGTVIPAGGSIYVAADVPSFLARTTGPHGGQNLFVQGNYAGRIPNSGSLLQLVAADETVVNEMTTPGKLNPYQGEVVLSEVHYHPADPPPGYTLTHLQLEFLEVHNRTGSSVHIGNWQVREGVTYDFPANAMLPAFGTIVLVPFSPADVTAVQEFRTLYGIGDNVTLMGPYGGQLSNGGEGVSLLAPHTPPGGSTTYLEVDRVDFLDVAPWPTEPDGGGSSLTRSQPTSPGQSAASWIAATPTPGYASPVAGDHDGDYDVDGADFLAWQRGYGTSTGARPTQGDSDRDGDVDANDLGAWKGSYGTAPSAAATAAAFSAALMAEPAARSFDAGLIDLAMAVGQQRPAAAQRTTLIERSVSEPAAYRPPSRRALLEGPLATEVLLRRVASANADGAASGDWDAFAVNELDEAFAGVRW